MNIIDFGPQAFVKAEVRTVAAEFAHVGVIAKAAELDGKEGGNFVLVASQQPLPTGAIRKQLGQRAELLDDPAAVRAFIGDAPLLTDDFAPVDQLLTPYPS